MEPPMRATDVPPGEPAMLTQPDVARMLQVTDRHIANLRRRNLIPPPVKLGESVRWPRRVILEWIDAGCPANSD